MKIETIKFSNTPMETTNFSEDHRKLKLIRLITLQVITVGFIFLCIYLYLNFTMIALMVLFGIVSAVINLKYTIQFNRTVISAHIINVLYLIVIGTNCYLMVGYSNSYLCWFLTVPIIAGSLINLRGLIGYSTAALVLIAVLMYVHSAPWQPIEMHTILRLDLINYMLVLQLTAFMSYAILQKNEEYSKALAESNLQLKSNQEKLHYLVRHDYLTNLPNRYYFNARLEELLNDTDSETHSITLFFMDINEFKEVNDQFGHEVGDQLLLAASRRLKNCLRKNDFIARLSGDEFTAIVVHKKTDDLPEILYARIYKEFFRSFKIGQQIITSSISIGKSQWPEYANNVEELFTIADSNMYQHKRTMKTQ